MSFQSLDLPDYLLEAVAALSYEKPTPIQEQAIPLILDGQDLVAEAQTGTGKTAAFALPIIKQLNELPDKKKKVSVLALVIVPTRELATQVAAAFKSYSKFSPKKIKMISLIGGENIQDQIRGLRMGTDVVIATPGRLLDLIKRTEIRLVELKTLVLDEADKMLDLGFAEELQALVEKLPSSRQNMFFSATFPQKVMDLSEKFLDNPTRVTIEEEQLTVEAIDQRVIEVNAENRRSLLQQLLATEKWRQVMVFVGSKSAARNLAIKLTKNGQPAIGFHGDLDQAGRFEALRQFKNKEVKVLVATDIAARGIDIEKLSCVINYDLPRSPMDYVHRIGRTGRAGESGQAVSFIDHDSTAHFKLIEKRANISLEREQIEGFELTGEASVKEKGKAPVKGKGKSKKDKLREQAAKKTESSSDDSASDVDQEK
jgi:ATP-dependent RNA helicase RhlE